MIKLKDVRVGSKVVVRPSFGGGRPMTVIVDEVDSDIKNGIPGISYITADNEGYWAYLSQVDRVIQY